MTATNDAAPAEVVQGRPARFVVTMRNRGVSTWEPGQGIVLAPEESPDTAAWSLAAVPVTQTVAPGWLLPAIGMLAGILALLGVLAAMLLRRALGRVQVHQTA